MSDITRKRWSQVRIHAVIRKEVFGILASLCCGALGIKRTLSDRNLVSQQILVLTLAEKNIFYHETQ